MKKSQSWMQLTLTGRTAPLVASRQSQIPDFEWPRKSPSKAAVFDALEGRLKKRMMKS